MKNLQLLNPVSLLLSISVMISQRPYLLVSDVIKLAIGLRNALTYSCPQRRLEQAADNRDISRCLFWPPLTSVDNPHPPSWSCEETNFLTPNQSHLSSSELRVNSPVAVGKMSFTLDQGLLFLCVLNGMGQPNLLT